jgi:hypothetical protein
MYLNKTSTGELLYRGGMFYKWHPVNR